MKAKEDRSQYVPPSRRRGFLKGCCAWLMGGAALLTAPVAGLRALLDPLRVSGGSGSGRWVRVARLSALPDGGEPRRFPVVADRINAWSRVSDVAIGAVFLRRVGQDGAQVQALSVICPHAGCLVDYDAAGSHYLCPCHTSRFDLDGRVGSPASPSPRGLDSLEVEIRDGEEVWVRYQEYRVGIEERVPLA